MVYLFLAPGFEEIEALAVVDILRRAEVEVTTVGVGGTLITGSHGITVAADVSDNHLHMTDIEMVVLPGGLPGTTNLGKSSTVRSAVEAAAVKGAWLAAICAAPSIFGHWSLLKGRRATCYPGYDRELSGATYTGEPVTVDGQIVTGKGAGTAVAFALQLVECLVDAETADRIRRSIQC